MLTITYFSMLAFITVVWWICRAVTWVKNSEFNYKRELQLMLVYVCIVVIARFVFFPFGRVDGAIQPLIFDSEKILPLRINLIPLVNLFDYEIKREAILNFVGNTLMFVPVGIVFPMVYKKLNSHTRVMLAGIVFSLAIELLQLPFYDRVSDIDDLILNSLGYLVGYLIYLAVKIIKIKTIKNKE